MKAVLFDLDGTLLDTRDMILNSLQYAYKKVLGEETMPPDKKFLSLVGIPLRKQMDIIDPERSDELFEAYHENNRLVHDKMLKGFEGTDEALAALQQKGLRMAVVTSKRHDPAVSGLEQMGLAHFFEFVIGADDSTEHKPEPGPLLLGAERMGLAPTECAYIGDSPYDMRAAIAAHMYAIGALWGMFDKETLAEAGAEVFADALADVVKFM